MSDPGGEKEGWLGRWLWVSLRVSSEFHRMASPPKGVGGMIGRETRVLLRHYLEQGMIKAACLAKSTMHPAQT